MTTTHTLPCPRPAPEEISFRSAPYLSQGAHRTVYGPVAGYVRKVAKDGYQAANVEEANAYTDLSRSDFLPECVYLPHTTLLSDGSIAMEYVDGVNPLPCGDMCYCEGLGFRPTATDRAVFGSMELWTGEGCVWTYLARIPCNDLHSENVRILKDGSGRIAITDLGCYSSGSYFTHTPGREDTYAPYSS